MPPPPDESRPPDAPEPALQVAARLLASGQPGEAAAALGRLAHGAPTYAAAHVLHATALEAAGYADDALAAWDRAAFLMPRSPLVRRERDRLRGSTPPPSAPVQAPEPPETDLDSDALGYAAAEGHEPEVADTLAPYEDAGSAENAAPADAVEPEARVETVEHVPDTDEAETVERGEDVPEMPLEEPVEPEVEASTAEEPVEQTADEGTVAEEPHMLDDERTTETEPVEETPEATFAPDDLDEGDDDVDDDPFEPIRAPAEHVPMPPVASLPGAADLDALDLSDLLGLPPLPPGPDRALMEDLDEAPLWPREVSAPEVPPDVDAADMASEHRDGGPANEEPEDDLHLETLSVDDLLFLDAPGRATDDDGDLPDWLTAFDDGESLDLGPPPAEARPPADAPPAVFADWGDARSQLLPPEPSDVPAPAESLAEPDDADGWALLGEDDRPPMAADPDLPTETVDPQPPVEAAASTEAPPDASRSVADELDALISSLADAPRIRPDPTFSGPALSTDVPEAGALASETLAKIYAAQKQYAEAAAVYERLAERDPERAAGFLERAAAMRAAAGSHA